jgi:phosphomannomutase
MKTLFLFDMDGTLTPPRQKMQYRVERMLSDIQMAGADVGIITGSDMNYVRQQCSIIFDVSPVRREEVHFLPCNGTKYIFGDKELYSNDMIKELGETNWRRLVNQIILLQYNLIQEHKLSFPLTGHFFNYRESTLNWCPIGRNAKQSDRRIWEELDTNASIRKPILEKLRNFLSGQDFKTPVTVKLGGDTSFDIFPEGWDKTYPLERTSLFDKYEKIYFLGDRCTPTGNDFEIFHHHRTEGIETDGPTTTVKIVNKILEDSF